MAGGDVGDWTWVTMGSSGPARVQLTAGKHALFISGRSRNFHVDRWVIYRTGQVSEAVWSDLSLESVFVTTTIASTTTTAATTTTISTTTVDGGALTLVDTPRSASPALYRINAGGPTFVDSFGQMWQEDIAYTGGRQFQANSAIAATTAADQPLFRSERNGGPRVRR
jgi:hypothetical protein